MKVEATDVRFESDERKSESGLLSEKNPPSPPGIGLALSSGGAKGLAHIGVLQVLEENNIPIDAIAGSSMGAYIAAVWAYGYSGAQMEKFAREVEGKWAWLRLLDPYLVPRSGLLRGNRTRLRLKNAIGEAQFSDLPRRLRIVATNLQTLERAVFSKGEVALAVQASTAIPGICSPVRVGEEMYFDGGVVDPLPVDVAREMSVESVIAVNVIPTPAYLRCRLDFEREQTAARLQQFGLGSRLIRRAAERLAANNVFDVIHRTMVGAQMRLAEHSCRHADVVLRPISFEAHWHDFHRPGKYIALGRKAAEEHLDEIKALLVRRRTTHETPVANNTLAVAA